MIAARLRTPVHAPVGKPATPARVTPLPATYVHPGQVFVSNGPGTLTTILGSCVAVCLHDPKLHLGGLNHYLLPNRCAPGELEGRYGPSAIAQLIDGMLLHGASPRRLVAHVVGGAAVLAAFDATSDHLGRRNIEIARELLSARHIPVLTWEVGGNRGRKLAFAPRDGAATVSLIGQ